MPHSKRFHSTALVGCIGLTAALGQACQFVDPPQPPQMLGGGSGGSYASWNGWYLPTSNTLRILIVLIEQDGTAGSTDWPAHSLPVWVNNHQKSFAPQASTRQPTAPEAVKPLPTFAPCAT